MAKLLVKTDWFYELKAIEYYTETEYENTILTHCKSLFPDFITISFKKEINNKSGEIRKADLALIRTDFKEWWVIEVERSDHSLEHVKKQVKVFVDGDYNRFDYSEYIIGQIKRQHGQNVSLKKIKKLIETNLPSVLVVVDDEKPDWEDDLKKLNVSLCTFEIYKDTNSNYSYRITGKYPFFVKKESPCLYSEQINTLEVVENSSVKENHGNTVEISYNGMLTKWLVIKEKKKLFLRYSGAVMPLNTNKAHVLKRDSRDRLFLERS
ncbi:MAG: hypothetical protein HYV29_11060 [Ignavibacteriales bacterium]|nr:hypothetical protein [Ignavibacteriales bacterium]